MIAAVYLPIWTIPTIAFIAIQGYLFWSDVKERRQRRRDREMLRRRRRWTT